MRWQRWGESSEKRTDCRTAVRVAVDEFTRVVCAVGAVSGVCALIRSLVVHVGRCGWCFVSGRTAVAS